MEKRHDRPRRRPAPTRRPDTLAPRPEATTLWDFPAQNYGGGKQGDTAYVGATPSYIIWNLLNRYTKPKELVIDPMAGSGTTLDVARELGRRALGYDVNPTRPDIFRVDSRKLPLEDGKAAFVFVDPPYSTHVDYSDDPRCIGKLDAASGEYYEAMERVIGEIDRVLAPGRHMALYVSDSFVKGKGFYPIGFELFEILRRHFQPVDIVSVVRHNRTLDMGNYRKAALDGNYFLRGFNYLFIMQKPVPVAAKDVKKRAKRKE
ncbi:MAG: site-specific DNA-methyltransferase [Planctomycetaceae bacterium]|nr:site-specific DNA-methyltransferase [Planctomycetaceae bacterium]